MTEIKKVKIQNFVETQIPEFLNVDNPLFKEFLEQYYSSLEHTTGSNDLINNLVDYIKIDNFNTETFFSVFTPCVLQETINSFDDTIRVNHTIGFPSKYGLIKIDDEIITYKSKTDTTFEECIRGFSGIDKINHKNFYGDLNFVSTEARSHSVGSTSIKKSFNDILSSGSSITFNVGSDLIFDVFDEENYTLSFSNSGSIVELKELENISFTTDRKSVTISELTQTGPVIFTALCKENTNQVKNLNLLFFQELFEKFKYQFVPGTENRSFAPELNLQTILSRAKDFYISKGTDASFKILFKILFNKDVDVVKPQEFLLRPSDNRYFITKNILVEKISGNLKPLELKGKTLKQNTEFGEASAVIYNVEIRPIDNNFLYEISLDPESFILDFVSTKKTKIIENVNLNPISTSTLIVDSTIGFPQSGNLIVKKSNGVNFEIQYEDKTINEFLNVTVVNQNILTEELELIYGDVLIVKNFASINEDNNQFIEFRIINIIGNIDSSKTSGLRVGDSINLSSFGYELSDRTEFGEWMYNLPITHRIKDISRFGKTVWEIELIERANFIKNSNITLYDDFDETNQVGIGTVNLIINSIINDNTISVTSSETLSNKKILKKSITKVNIGSSSHNLNNITSNIQNTYIDFEKNHLYVSSSGFPSYEIIPNTISFNGTANTGIGATTVITTDRPERLYDGERVHITPSSNSGISTGIYFVSTLNELTSSRDISIAYNNSDLFFKNYIVVSVGSTFKIQRLSYKDKEIKEQNLFKKIPLNSKNLIINKNKKFSTSGVSAGILINGVELYSSTTIEERIYYGKLENIIVTNSGKDYDVINTPELAITDEVIINKETRESVVYGSGAKAHLNITGKVSAVRIINSGSGYNKDIKISIGGGNGVGANLRANVIKSRITSGFRGNSGINDTNDIITFTSNHNFDDGELVEYFTNDSIKIKYFDSQSPGTLLSIPNNSYFYVGVVTANQIKLYPSRQDSSNKTNSINLGVTTSKGYHYFRTLESKNTLFEVNVENSGFGYSNKKVVVPSIINVGDFQNGINTNFNYIYAKNHNFTDKDLVVYSTTGTVISGISTNKKYFIKVIDENKFSLVNAGIGNTITDEEFIDNKIVRITGIGTGTHTFSFPPIVIEVEAFPDNTRGELILPTLEPVVLGEIESVFVENYGVGYGVSTVLNFHRRPNVNIKPPISEVLLRPVVIDGVIVDIQILSSGRGYTKDINLIVDGSGKFADLYPVIENGRVVSVNIINGGIGYDKNSTIRVVNRGRDAKFLADIYEWKINQVEKNKDILNDGGILVDSKNKLGSLQYINFYAPKKLRIQLDDNTDGDKEIFSGRTSPIIGWAYDGFPIYGPYYFINNEPSRIRSGYTIPDESAPNSNLRPSVSRFPLGFFIQDYQFNNDGDLDEYNGKFVINKEFPEGTYAYFSTLDQNGSPQYPYFIGSYFKGFVDEKTTISNYDYSSIGNELNLIRNTSPYYLNSKSSYYNIINNVDEKYKQEFSVDVITKGGIDKIELYDSGENYQVGDILEFDDVGAGTGIYASVFDVMGKSIDTFNLGITTYTSVVLEKTGNSITAIANTYFNLKNNEIVNISNISDSIFNFLSGNKKIILSSKEVGLAKSFTNVGIAGTITVINVSDINEFEIDDFIQIDEEVLKILEIYPKTNNLRVQNLSNSGIHTAGISRVKLLPRKITFFFTGNNINSSSNKTVYFNPNDVISVNSGIKTYTSPNNEIINIPKKSIYIPNHSYQTGQPLSYHSGVSGSPLVISNSISGPTYSLVNNQTVYAINLGKNLVGISTVGVNTSGIGITAVYFRTPIVGIAHSLKTTFNEVTAKVENYSINIQTSENHNLETDDIIKIDAIPSSTETIKLQYDVILKRITGENIIFNAGIASTTTSSIVINDENLITGDKIIYYSNGNTIIGGLQDNHTYFIINEEPGTIKFANYYADAVVGNAITFTTIGDGNQRIVKINPTFNVSDNNTIIFDLSSPTLSGISSIKLYRDAEYTKELETYNYVTEAGNIELDLTKKVFPTEIYYQFFGVEVDTEVLAPNRIKVVSNKIENEFRVIKISSNQFRINLNRLYDNFKYEFNLKYYTRSKTALGPIKSINVNYSGRGYDKKPRLSKIKTQRGKNAVIKIKSNQVGKIDRFERIKDGFDYPTDPTLLPILSSPSVVQLEDISRVDYVGIISGGKNYNTVPTLKVIGNDRIKLQAVLKGTSITEVNIIENTDDLSKPLPVIPTRNSNGYGIDDITVNGSNVTLALVNSIIQIYPLITTGYGTTETVFPFSVGDEVFIERCRIEIETDDFGDITSNTKDNFNSASYDYRFFTVTGISTENYTVTYSMNGVKDNLQLGNYTSDFGYGYVINKKDMAQFEMFIKNDLSYFSDEKVFGFNNGKNTFSAKVLKNGWDNEINELRLTDVRGELKVGDKLRGEISKLNGTVTDVNIFNLETKLDVKRDKQNYLGDSVGFLNDFYQRISDNNYYQKFSYSLLSEVQYDQWKEPIKSLVHPSGYKEFSDLIVYNKSNVGMKTNPTFSDYTINIDNTQSLYTKNNFASVIEEDLFEDGSIERIKIEEGPKLKPYILAKSNKVILIDDISSQFDGTSKLEIIASKPVTFISTDLYRVAVSTSNLKVGDLIGYSTYHNTPDGVLILSIENGRVSFSSNLPHRLYSINGISTSVTETLNFYRRVPGDAQVGLTTFKLKNNGVPIFYRKFDASNGITTSIDLINNKFLISNHNFQTGQKIIYTPNTDPYIAIANTTIGSGAILEPVFDEETYSVKNINVIQGGSGYNNNVSIAITGTQIPHIVGIFTGRVQSGVITSVSIGNSGLGYYPISYPVGIVTTSEVEGRKDIILSVGGGIGSAIYENGYNVGISTTIVGVATTAPSSITSRFFAQFPPHIPVKSTTGIGTEALFTVLITYDTGNPISTAIILRDGGRGYSIGDTVSIAGTYLGGSTPTNDLSFVVSKVSSTKVGTVSQTYTNIPGTTTVGYGSGATFSVTRTDGNISSVIVVNGGVNYTLTNNISIAGTFIGGSTPGDNLFLSPTVLGTDKLPKTLYVDKTNKDELKVSGISTGDILDLNSLGIGTHSFAVEDPSVNSMISIDNIVQTPVYRNPTILTLGNNISFETNEISIQSGISSVIINDYIKIDDEYLKVKNFGSSPNTLLVERGTIGSKVSFHNKSAEATIYRGNYRIVDDVIYFSSAPYGPTGIPGLEVRSAFNGRAFSRRFDPFIPNENLIFDDISNQFTGIAATEFILKSNGNNVSGMFTDINGVFLGASSGDINQNPFVLINNVLQTGGTDYNIDTPGQNTIKFISGVPIGGKITKISYTKGFGYLPLVGASATVSVSAAGTISNVFLSGFGKGYKEAPLVSIISGVGTGGIITSTVSSGGTITALTIVNAGFGYTSSPLPEIRIDLPQNSYNIPLIYANNSSGMGTQAKASVIIGNGSSVTSLVIDEPGTGYKVGDILVAPGIKTEANNANFEEFKITVEETFTDSFSGWYPGQFIQFDDISRFFNGFRKRFVPTVTIGGNTQVISLLAQDPADISVGNNLFVFVNDILQVPNESYNFTGTRIIFKEAPKAGSKCTILFFRGSDLDVEQVDPPRTIKEGDLIQIDENINYPFDRTQFERVVKDVVSVDVIDTFTYDSIGISIDDTNLRPLHWTKQTQDRVQNGTLYSKSRPNLKSKIIPFAKVIKDVDRRDTQIYVDSAIPLFEDIDENRTLTEDLRNIVIFNNKDIETPVLEVAIDDGGTVSNINTINSGKGYSTIINPTIVFNQNKITKKDPLFLWNYEVGITTTSNYNSIGYGTGFIAVGNTGAYAFSLNGTDWNLGQPINANYNFNDVIGVGNTYVSIGSSGSIYNSVGLSSTNLWLKIPLLELPGQINVGNIELEDLVSSSFVGEFSKISYNSTNQISVVVGGGSTYGIIFNSVGIETSYYLRSATTFNQKINSVANNSNIFVSVGNSGVIYFSIGRSLTGGGSNWDIKPSSTSNNLNDVIWDGNQFIVVGDSGIILTSNDGNNWTSKNNNLTSNIVKINYFDGLYTVLDVNENLYYSFNLSKWIYRSLNTSKITKDIIGNIDSENNPQYISVGSSGLIGYSIPVINRATAISTTVNGSLSSVTLVNEGFGYPVGTSSTVLTIIESEPVINEDILSIKAKGDFGNIIGVEELPHTFGDNRRIKFTLKSNNYPTKTLLPDLEYSPIQKGDYFTLFNTNISPNQFLVGVTTLSGIGTTVGISTPFIDGIYRAEELPQTNAGITTLICAFNNNASLFPASPGLGTFYGNYSYGVIYDYQNRARRTPKAFTINKTNGIIGLNTGPAIYRTRGLV